MRAFSTKAWLQSRASRRHLAVRATIAPSRPQQETAKKAPSVNAKVQYVKPAPNGEDLFIYLYEKPENIDRVTNLEHVETEVPFTDLRTIESQSGEFTIEKNGFQLEKMHVPSDVDWDNDKDVSMLAQAACSVVQLSVIHLVLSASACNSTNATWRSSKQPRTHVPHFAILQVAAK